MVVVYIAQPGGGYFRSPSFTSAHAMAALCDEHLLLSDSMAHSQVEVQVSEVHEASLHLAIRRHPDGLCDEQGEVPFWNNTGGQGTPCSPAQCPL